MSAEAYELDPGPITAGTGTEATKRYIVVNAGDNEAAAYNAVRFAAPAEYAHPSGSTIPISAIELDTYQGNGVWFGTVSYSSATGKQAPSEAGTGNTPSELPQPPADNANLAGMSFSTSGGTLHITQSRATIDSKKAGGGNPPDNKQAIGVHGDSDQIDGTDIVVPKLEFTVKRRFGQVTLAYLRTLRDLTGTVNASKFMRFEAGEVLFLGASGDMSKDGWELSFTFAISPNEANLNVGNGMIFDAKKG